MPSISYKFGDVLTGQIIEEVSLQGVSMTRGLGLGELRGTCSLDQSGKNNRDLIEATQQGRCFVVAERNNGVIWDGFIKTNTYQSQSKTMQLFCQAWELYPIHRFIETNFVETDVEQRNIFRNLWLAMMDDPNTPTFELPSSFDTIVEKSININSFEYKSFRSAMDLISQGFDGFDWTIDTSRVDDAYVRTVRIGYPTIGAINPIYIDYPGAILNYWRNGLMTDRGTNIFGLGSGEGSTMLVQPVVHQDLLDSGFPRFDVAISLKSVNDATLLQQLVTQLAATLKPGVPILTIELKADKDPEFASYGLGDAIVVNIDDARHPDPVDQTYDTRILGWEYYPPSSERTEEVRLVFEGVEL